MLNNACGEFGFKIMVSYFAVLYCRFVIGCLTGL